MGKDGVLVIVSANFGKDYPDNAEPISSSIPKPTTAGPNMACQRGGEVCGSLRGVAIIPSKSPTREFSWSRQAVL